MMAGEGCNKIKYESYLEHFQYKKQQQQQQQQHENLRVDDSYNYNNILKAVEYEKKFYDTDTFVIAENGLTTTIGKTTMTENINADKRSKSSSGCGGIVVGGTTDKEMKLCYIHTGEYKHDNNDDVDDDVDDDDDGNDEDILWPSGVGGSEHNQWIVSDTLRSSTDAIMDADKDSFVLSSNGNVLQKQHQQHEQLSHVLGILEYKQQTQLQLQHHQQQQQQQQPPKSKRLHNITHKKMLMCEEEIQPSPWGMKKLPTDNRGSGSRSRSSSSGSHFFDENDDYFHYDDHHGDVINDDGFSASHAFLESHVSVLGISSAYDDSNDDYENDVDNVDNDDDDNTAKNMLYERKIFQYSGNHVEDNVAHAIGDSFMNNLTSNNINLGTTTSITTTATTATNTAAAKINNKNIFRQLGTVTTTTTATATFTTPTTISKMHFGSSSLNSSTLSTASSSSTSASITSQQQQQLKYLTPNYNLEHQYQQQARYSSGSDYYEHFTTSTATTTPITRNTGRQIIMGNEDFSEYHKNSAKIRAHAKLLKHQRQQQQQQFSLASSSSSSHRNNLPIISNADSPAFINALNYYGTGAAVDSLYAHTYSQPQAQPTVSNTYSTSPTTLRIDGRIDHRLSYSSSGSSTGNNTLMAQRYQMGTLPTTDITIATDTTTSLISATTATITSARPQGTFVLEYEC